MFWYETDSPVGRLLLAGDVRALQRLYFQAGPRPFTPPAAWRHDAAPFAPVLAQLDRKSVV